MGLLFMAGAPGLFLLDWQGRGPMGAAGTDARDRHTLSLLCQGAFCPGELPWPRIGLHRAGQREGSVMWSEVPGLTPPPWPTNRLYTSPWVLIK